MSAAEPSKIELHTDGPLLLVGCGNMGGAMLRGWLARGLSADQIVVQEPNPSADLTELADQHGLKVVGQYEGAMAPAVMLMAVKPQVMADVFARVASFASPDTVVLSVAAGRTIDSFRAGLPAGAGIVRTIPNTPSAVGHGMTVCVGSNTVTDAQKAACTALLEAIGEVGWVDDEALIDAATAVCGSGPAYVFLLAETMAAAGVRAGLPEALAAQLATQTVSGAARLLKQSAEEAAQLRRNVTSPNGTTQAALEVLMHSDTGLGPLMTKAVDAATRRSRELAE